MRHPSSFKRIKFVAVHILSLNCRGCKPAIGFRSGVPDDLSTEKIPRFPEAVSVDHQFATVVNIFYKVTADQDPVE